MRICNFCKHYGRVAWDHKNPGCTLAKERGGSGGYGPWWEAASCKHDENYKEPKDLFEPATQEDFGNKTRIIRSLEDQLDSAKHKIAKLEWSITKLASEVEK